MADELAAEIETLTDAVKEHMTAAGVDTLSGTDYKVTWRDVSSRRLDSAALKRDHAELYSQYSRETVSKRFTLA
jgi:predicted phage-related endonuclease